MTFSNYVVTDSLCCPSRSSIFTGKFPHDTGVYTNNSPDGGFAVFHSRGNEKHTYGLALQNSGYATGMMGKYLNGYVPTQKYVPPGWSEWDVSGKAYGEYNYNLNENNKVVHYGGTPADYLTDVMSAKGSDFIARNAAAKTPFALEIAAYAPHSPYVPAAEDLSKFPGLKAPRTKAFDKTPGQRAGLAGRAHRAVERAEGPAGRDLPQARTGGAVGGPDDRQPARLPRSQRGGRQHVLRVQLRQRLPPGRIPPRRGQADGVRHRRARATGGRWAERARRAPHGTRSPRTSTWHRPSKTWPGSRSRRASTGTAWSRCCTARRPRTGGRRH